MQILHAELETALQSVQLQLEATESELEKQRALNEKLETDLLQMDQRKADGGISGAHTPANGTSTPADVLAGLDLGKKTVRTTVDSTHIVLILFFWFRIYLRGAHPFRSRRQQIPPYCLL